MSMAMWRLMITMGSIMYVEILVLLNEHLLLAQRIQHLLSTCNGKQ